MRYIALTVMLGAAMASADHDYFNNARLPGVRQPEVSLDKVEQEGSETPTDYQRRVVSWWPKKGVDIIDVPRGVELRTWTINPKMLPDGRSVYTPNRSRSVRWLPKTLRGKKQFRAHLIAFRGVGLGIGNPWKRTGDPDYCVPAVVLRLADGRKRCFVSDTFIEADERYICNLYEKEMARIRKLNFKSESRVSDRRLDEYGGGKGALYTPGATIIESEHFAACLGTEPPGDNAGSRWLIADDKELAARNRMQIMRGWEDWWTYLEYAGHLMPFWEKTDPVKTKYAITIGGTKRDGHNILSRGNGGSYGGMTTANGNWWGMYHEWTHGQLCGGMISLGGGETACDTAQIVGDPRVMAKVMFQVVKPWKNLFWGAYPGGYGWTMIGDDPNWGYAAVTTIPPMMAANEHTPMHALARLGKRRGIFKNGVRGVGDMLGQVGARMAEFDVELQSGLRGMWHMPTRVSLRTLDHERRLYRSPVTFSPEPFGVNIVKIVPDKGAASIDVDFQGHFDAATFSDWRACIVAVDSQGRCRYSALWNKGSMRMEVKDGDERFWLTVTATPYALSPSIPSGVGAVWTVYQGSFSYRYPYDVQFKGCRPGSPHTTLDEDDQLDFAGGAWGMRRGEGANCANIPAVAGAPRYDKTTKSLQAILDRGVTSEEITKFLDNAQGRPHPNGGGWVAASAKVDQTAYVAPGAMVLDGAKVLGDAVISDYVIVMGPRVTVKDSARIYGKLVIDGEREYSGDARVYRRDEDKGAVAYAIPQLRKDRFEYAGHRLQANYDMEAPETVLLEDHYREHSTSVFFYGAHRTDHLIFDGVLKGKPGYEPKGDGGAFTFNGKDQYAQLPGEVADLEEITLNLMLRTSETGTQTLFEFGSTDTDFFALTLTRGILKLTVSASGKAVEIVSRDKVPTGVFATCRVEIDGKAVVLYIDEKEVGRKASSFRASDAFVPGRPRLGALAAGRDGTAPLAGAIDFFRIYNTIYTDFRKAPAPLVASRKIAANYVARFNKAFPNFDNIEAMISSTAQGHPITAYYARYNQIIGARVEALEASRPAATRPIEKQIAQVTKKIRALNAQVARARQGDRKFAATRTETAKKLKKIQAQLSALWRKDPRWMEADERLKKANAIYGPAKAKAVKEGADEYKQLLREVAKAAKRKYADPRTGHAMVRARRAAATEYIDKIMARDPAVKQAMFERTKYARKRMNIQRTIQRSVEGQVLKNQVQALSVKMRYKPDRSLAAKMNDLAAEKVRLEGKHIAVRTEAAVAENPAEYRALRGAEYFARTYGRTFEKSLRLQLNATISDDILQVRKARRLQSKKWYTDADWDGRAPYEYNPASIKQPVMQMWLKKMKPWMYK